MKSYQRFANSLSIGIEIGGTKTQVGIGSAVTGLLPGGIGRRHVIREHGAAGILQDIVSMADEIVASQHLTLSKIGSIGIGYGGILDSARGVTLKSYQVEGWTNFPL